MNPISISYTPSSTKQNITYFCFNPFCKQSFNRIFSVLSQHSNDVECSRWIITKDHIIVSQNKDKQDNQKKGIFLQFQQKPMQIIMKSNNLKDQCQLQLKKYLQKIKLDMQVTLWTAHNLLMMKIDNYFNPLTNFYNQVKSYTAQFNQTASKQKQSLKLNKILQNLNLHQIKQIQSKVFLSDCSQYEQKIKSSIQQLSQNIFCTKLSLISDIGLNNTQKTNLIKYLKDPLDQHNKKSNKLINLFKIQLKNIYEKKSKNINSQNISQLILKCPLCSVNVSTQKRKQLLNLWNYLIQHIINTHLQQAGYCYQHLISGKASRQITIDQILYKIINYQYQALQFIYKSGKKGYIFNYINRKKLTIQIRIKGQTQQLPLKYIQISQFHQFCSVIATIAYNMQKNMYKSKPIYIYLNNQSQICYIRRICDLLILKNIFIINQRRNQQSTIIYQQDIQDIDKDKEKLQQQLWLQDLDFSRDSKDSKDSREDKDSKQGKEKEEQGNEEKGNEGKDNKQGKYSILYGIGQEEFKSNF